MKIDRIRKQIQEKEIKIKVIELLIELYNLYRAGFFLGRNYINLIYELRRELNKIIANIERIEHDQ